MAQHSISIQSSTLAFLRDLQANNHREWFQDNKTRYESAYENMIAFSEELLEQMSEIDHIVPRSGKKTLFRIYRDVRFSKDKSPYKSYWGGSLKRATPWLRGGYYFHVEPGGSFMGGGFWGPNAADLARIRAELASEAEPLRAILASKEVKRLFGSLQGEQVKTAPKGYARDQPNIDLIRYKQFVMRRSFSDAEVLKPSFMAKLVESFKGLRPFFDYMSEVLTTDGNGNRIEPNA